MDILNLKRATLALAAAAAIILSANVGAFVIETELTGDSGGNPEGDLHKVTISGAAGDGGGANSFTVTWTVPEGTNGDSVVPFDLVTVATFTVLSLSETELQLKIDLDNTQVLADAIAAGEINAGEDPSGLHSLLAFGFNAAPEIDGVTLITDTAGGADWTADLATGNGEGLPGGFKPLNVCMWAAQSCNGGTVHDGLIAGETDSLTLSLTGTFDGPMIMLLDFPAKTQGVWGSFETGGIPDCCDKPPGGGDIPEPNTMALILFGLAGFGTRRLRRTAA